VTSLSIFILGEGENDIRAHTQSRSPREPFYEIMISKTQNSHGI